MILMKSNEKTVRKNYELYCFGRNTTTGQRIRYRVFQTENNCYGRGSREAHPFPKP